jgi:PilZ domain
MKGNVLEAELRRARRVTHLGRVFLLGDCGFFRGLAYLQDLSTTGCRVISESPLQVGMELELSLFAASDERDIVIELAKVRWANGDRFGLEFVAIYPQERERLRLFLKTVVMPPVSDVAGE